MSTPFLGEIRLFCGSFAPLGWALCNGQLLDVSTNAALYQLIGTLYGGDGTNTFALPDLRGRVPVHQGTTQGTTFVIGQQSGSETVTLVPNQMPQHTHSAACNSGGGTNTDPTNRYWAADSVSTENDFTGTIANTVAMNAGAVTPAGGSQPHDNMMPFLTVNFIIATAGIFPTQN